MESFEGLCLDVVGRIRDSLLVCALMPLTSLSRLHPHAVICVALRSYRVSGCTHANSNFLQAIYCRCSDEYHSHPTLISHYS